MGMGLCPTRASRAWKPRYKSPTSWDCYRVQRNLVVSLVRKAKINYNTKTNQALSDPAISSKKWWRIAKSMYGNMCCSAIGLAFSEADFFISDPKKKVNVFNDYFASQATVPNSYSAEIPFFLRWSSDSLSVITADEEMVRNLTSSANISKPTSYHGISDKIIIHCSEGLYKPVTSLINTSFRLG